MGGRAPSGVGAVPCAALVGGDGALLVLDGRAGGRGGVCWLASIIIIYIIIEEAFHVGSKQ